MQIDSVIIRHSPIVLLYRILALTAGISLAYTLFELADTYTRIPLLPVHPNMKPLVIFAGTMTIETVAMAILFLQWAYKTFELRTTELIFQKGIFYKNRTIHSLVNIQSVESEQSFLGIIFNYGSIKLYNPLLRQEIHMRYIPDPEKYAQALRNILDIQPQHIIPRTFPEKES